MARVATAVVIFGVVATSLWLAIRTRPPQTFAPLVLAISNDTRRALGSQVPTVRLPLNVDALRLSLPFPEPAPKAATHRVQWENVKGPLKDLEIEKQDVNSVSVVIPADELIPGQYMLKLFRKNPNETEERELGNYPFNADE